MHIENIWNVKSETFIELNLSEVIILRKNRQGGVGKTTTRGIGGIAINRNDPGRSNMTHGIMLIATLIALRLNNRLRGGVETNFIVFSCHNENSISTPSETCCKKKLTFQFTHL